MYNRVFLKYWVGRNSAENPDAGINSGRTSTNFGLRFGIVCWLDGCAYSIHKTSDRHHTDSKSSRRTIETIKLNFPILKIYVNTVIIELIEYTSDSC